VLLPEDQPDGFNLERGPGRVCGPYEDMPDLVARRMEGARQRVGLDLAARPQLCLERPRERSGSPLLLGEVNLFPAVNRHRQLSAGRHPHPDFDSVQQVVVVEP
jgi:hypothetical protein